MWLLQLLSILPRLWTQRSLSVFPAKSAVTDVEHFIFCWDLLYFIWLLGMLLHPGINKMGGGGQTATYRPLLAKCPDAGNQVSVDNSVTKVVPVCHDLGEDRVFVQQWWWLGINSPTPIPLFMPGSAHSGSVSCDDFGRMFTKKLRVSSFLDRFPHYAWTATVSPLQLHWVKGVCVFRCNLPPALLAQWPRSFTCHCVDMGLEQTLNKSQHTSGICWSGRHNILWELLTNQTSE